LIRFTIHAAIGVLPDGSIVVGTRAGIGPLVADKDENFLECSGSYFGRTEGTLLLAKRVDAGPTPFGARSRNFPISLNIDFETKIDCLEYPNELKAVETEAQIQTRNNGVARDIQLCRNAETLFRPFAD
jgi:hypothetical protein